MATPAVTNTLANGTTVDADDLNENFTDLVDFLDDETVHLDGSKTMTGILTLPASDPTTANQATRKSYVDALNTAQTAALATHHGAASTDHDDRYYTETEIDARNFVAGGSAGYKTRSGSTTITFSGNPASSVSSLQTVTGITSLQGVSLTCVGSVAVALCMPTYTGNTFTVQGSTITDVDYSGTITVVWIAYGA
jgi:hypothetical protein